MEIHAHIYYVVKDATICVIPLETIPLDSYHMKVILSSCLNLFLCKSALKIKMTGNPNHCMITPLVPNSASFRLWNAFRQNPCDAGFQDVAWHSSGLAFLFCCGYSGGHYLCLWKRWCSTWTGWTTRDCSRCLKDLKDTKTRRVDTYHIYENRDWT